MRCTCFDGETDLLKPPRLDAQGVFTPNKYTMEISSKLYEHWKFTDQGLPYDLVARCSLHGCFRQGTRMSPV